MNVMMDAVVRSQSWPLQSLTYSKFYTYTTQYAHTSHIYYAYTCARETSQARVDFTHTIATA